MAIARDIMTSRAVTLRETHTLDDACRLLREAAAGSLPLCDEAGRFRGVVTARDVLRTMRSLGPHAGHLKVRDLVQGDAVTVEADDPVEKVIAQMALSQLTELPVLENGTLVGSLSSADVAQFTPLLRIEELAEHLAAR